MKLLIQFFALPLLVSILSLTTEAATHVKNFNDLVRGGKNASTVFKQEITNNKIVVLKCTMKNCPPCKKIAPQFEALAEIYKDVARFIELDVHLFDEVIRPYNIKKAPSFIIFYLGRHATTLRGSETIKDIAKVLDTQLKKEAASQA